VTNSLRVDPFSLITILAHGVDVSASVSAAAEDLGISREMPAPVSDMAKIS
jgi:hypothetical protein